MPYRKEKYRVLAGGLSLLPPGDKIAAEDSLQLTNWRVDQAGQLRSRHGMYHLSGYLAGGNGHTLFRQSPNRRYLGNGGFLYRSEGLGAYDLIYAGFDSQPLGMATKSGFTWVMNPAFQGKDDGSGNLKKWLPAPPATAPAAAPGAQVSRAVSPFSSTEGWGVTQPSGDTSGVTPVVDASTGTVAVTTGSVTVTGTGVSGWNGVFLATKKFQVSGDVASYTIVSNTALALTLNTPYLGPTNAAAAYSIFHNLPVFDFASTASIDGQSLHIACNPPGTWQARLTAANDLRLIDQVDADKFRIWMYASNPGAVDQITLSVDVNTGNFDLDHYDVTLPGSALGQAAFGWTQLEIRRALDAAGLLQSNPDYVALLAQINQTTDPLQLDALNQSLAQLRAGLLDSLFAFSRTGSTAGKNWGTVAAVRITVVVNAAVDINFDAWDVVGGANGSLEGEFQYLVTFDTPAGHESNPSPASAVVTLDKQGATLTGIAVSTDAQVTNRHIYRSGGTLNAPLRIGTIPDNTATTFTDLVSDETAQSIDTQMPIDHDPPPPALGLVRHLGKLIAYNTVKHPGRYFWTPAGQPWFFPGSDDEALGNWQDTGEDADPIIGATSHNQVLKFYKARSIARLFGDPDTADPEISAATIGLIGPRALCSIGKGLDALAGAEGIYTFNWDFETKISQKIDPIFKGDFVVLSTLGGIADVTIAPMNQDQKASAVLEHINGRLYFSYVSGGGPTPDITLVCDLETKRWYHHALDPAANGAGGFSALYYEGQDRALVGAVTTAAGVAVYEMELNNSDDGNPIPLAWHSRYSDQGLPDNVKTYAELVVVYKTGDQNGTSPLVVKLYYDSGATQSAIGTINSAVRARQVFPLGSNGLGVEHRNFALRIEGNATTDCIIYEAYMHWYAEARHGRGFDTGVIDLGSQLVKQVDKLELEVTAVGPGTLTWFLHGDLPGGAIVQRMTGTTQIDTARRNLEVVLPQIHEARKLRLLGTADVEFQPHAVRVSVIEIGQYVDGGQGDKWVSKEVSYG